MVLNGTISPFTASWCTKCMAPVPVCAVQVQALVPNTTLLANSLLIILAKKSCRAVWEGNNLHCHVVPVLVCSTLRKIDHIEMA